MKRLWKVFLSKMVIKPYLCEAIEEQIINNNKLYLGVHFLQSKKSYNKKTRRGEKRKPVFIKTRSEEQNGEKKYNITNQIGVITDYERRIVVFDDTLDYKRKPIDQFITKGRHRILEV